MAEVHGKSCAFPSMVFRSEIHSLFMHNNSMYFLQAKNTLLEATVNSGSDVEASQHDLDTSWLVRHLEVFNDINGCFFLV